MKFFTLIAVTVISASSSAEELFAYKLNVVRDGKKLEQVAYAGWSGEYPGPVIDVQSKKSGKTSHSGH